MLGKEQCRRTLGRMVSRWEKSRQPQPRGADYKSSQETPGPGITGRKNVEARCLKTGSMLWTPLPKSHI